MGVARLSKVTIIAPRSEYGDVATALARFEDFHPVEGAPPDFDPGVQELAVKAVKLFAVADQAVKDLGLQLMPGQMDIVLRGVKVPQSVYEAKDWGDLLAKAESGLSPIADKVRTQKALIQKASKEEADLGALKEALGAVAGFSSDLGGLSSLKTFRALLVVIGDDKVEEFRRSLPQSVLVVHSLAKQQNLVLVATDREYEDKVDKALKFLEVKPFSLPPTLPQNPAEAYRKVAADLEAAARSREGAESQMEAIKKEDGTSLLELRELAGAAKEMLDEARVSGGMKRLATISGYIPAKEEGEFRKTFSRWMVHAEPVRPGEEGVPTLIENGTAAGLFEPIVRQQGIPGGHEVDPTPLVSFVFPIFFGMMFGDFGHGAILAIFGLLVRQRGKGSLRQWGNIILIAGLSSMVFGAIFGEFFELSLYSFVPIPPLIEIIQRPLSGPNTFLITGVYTVMEIAILIGVAHLTLALSLDIYQGAKAGDRTDLVLEKVPALTMYLSGVGYGLAFIGGGFSFDVFKTSAPAPLLGIPNDVLGAVSLAILLPSMVVLMAGKTIAIAMGRVSGGSALGALANGGLEVFERISQFLSNTVSYVRLAVMLFVHAGLLLITNQYFGPSSWGADPAYVVPWVIFNVLILSFEGFIVYVQDLRLHLYEFFTKFFEGEGRPFRQILPERARVSIKWL